MAIRDYRDLEVWQRGMDLAESIYRLVENFPKTETYGLTSQLKRCAVSIPSNIAEGHGRETTKDYLRFLSIAMGSIAELEKQVLPARRLKYAGDEEAAGLLADSALLGRKLRNLQKSLKAKLPAR